ncbi:hypothetical protein AHAS_Ahas01G0132900 [Arachis hypogaea]
MKLVHECKFFELKIVEKHGYRDGRLEEPFFLKCSPNLSEDWDFVGFIVYSSAKLVDLALEFGKIYEGEGFKYIQKSFANGTLHLIGLLSDVNITGNAIYDPIGSIVVGNLLGMVAIFLIQRNRHALIDRAMDDHGDYIKEGQLIGYLDQFGTSLPVKVIFLSLFNCSTKIEGIPEKTDFKDDNLVYFAGATGRVGSRTVRELIKLGFKVRAGVRSAERAGPLIKSVEQMKLDDGTSGGSQEDTLFGGQVSNHQVAELMAVMAKNPDLAYCKIVEVVAETTTLLTPTKELLAKISSQRPYISSPKKPGVAAVSNPTPSEPAIATASEKETTQPKSVAK